MVVDIGIAGIIGLCMYFLVQRTGVVAGFACPAGGADAHFTRAIFRNTRIFPGKEKNASRAMSALRCAIRGLT